MPPSSISARQLCKIGVYRKLAVVVGWLGLRLNAGMQTARRGFVVRFSREHDRRRGEYHTR
jgi:hypothetical protein